MPAKRHTTAVDMVETASDPATHFLIKPSLEGGMHMFSASDKFIDIAVALQTIELLAEDSRVFAKAWEDMTIYYD